MLVPDKDSLVRRSGRERMAVRTVGDHIDRSRMSAKLEGFLRWLVGLPSTDDSIVARRGDRLAVSAETEAVGDSSRAG